MTDEATRASRTTKPLIGCATHANPRPKLLFYEPEAAAGSAQTVADEHHPVREAVLVEQFQVHAHVVGEKP